MKINLFRSRILFPQFIVYDNMKEIKDMKLVLMLSNNILIFYTPDLDE